MALYKIEGKVTLFALLFAFELFFQDELRLKHVVLVVIPL